MRRDTIGLVSDTRPHGDDLLCIGGRGGAGKTVVAAAVSSLLKEAGVAHCRIDRDELDLAYPQAPPELFEANFRSLWGNYREHGSRRLVYSNHAALRQVDRLRRLMGGAPVVTGVLLLAGDDVVRERLRAREHGRALEWHLRNLGRTPVHERDQDAMTAPWAVRIRTDGRTVGDVAAEVVAATTWVGGAGR